MFNIEELKRCSNNVLYELNKVLKRDVTTLKNPHTKVMVVEGLLCQMSG